MGASNFPINGTDHIEMYVGNAKQSSLFYQHCFGFKLIAYSGPETGVRDRASYVLQQEKIRLVLTTAMQGDSEIAQHVQRHGDGVKVLALWVDDARKAFDETVVNGAENRGSAKNNKRRIWRSGFGLHKNLRRNHPHICGKKKL
jgi:4-hydroxyphenylpyruvate dioxygenase